MRLTPGRVVAVLAAVAAIAALRPAPAGAQDWKGRGRAQGVVLSEDDGEPIADAKVTLRLAEKPDDGPEPLTTDKKGRWSYLGLTRGTWTVLIEHPDYVSTESSVKVTESGPPPKPVVVRVRSLQSVIDEETAKRSAELRAKLEKANELFSEGSYTEARAEYEKTLEDIDEESQPEVLMGIARTYYLEDKEPDAIATLEKILAINPDHVDALKLLSSLLVSEGRTEEAQQYIARLPEGEKLDPNAILNPAIDKYNAGDLEGALADCDSVVANYPDFAEAYYTRGLVHLALTQNDLARADFQKLLELAPDYPKREEVEQYLDYLGSESE